MLDYMINTMCCSNGGEWGNLTAWSQIPVLLFPMNPWANHSASFCLTVLINKVERIASTYGLLGVLNEFIFRNHLE